MADKPKDISKQQQLTIVLWHVDINTRFIHDNVLEATSLNAESLTGYILDTLRTHE